MTVPQGPSDPDRTTVDVLLALEEAREEGARARLRRTAVPAALVLFLGLAATLLGDRIWQATETATLVWYAVFALGTGAGLAWNHRSAGRALLEVDRRIAELEGFGGAPQAEP